MTKERDQTLACAGMFQTSTLIEQLARKGTINGEDYTSCINSLFVMQPETTIDVYEDITKLSTGLRSLQDNLTGKERNNDITRYVISMMHLGKQLQKDNVLFEQLGNKLEKLNSDMQQFEFDNSTITHRLAGLYTDYVKPLSAPVLVSGEPVYLENKETASKVRALLLAGVRSAVLWRQLGGNRFKLVLNRKRYLEYVKEMKVTTIE